MSVTLAVRVLAALRTMQLLSVAPMLHDVEWLQFANLAQVLASGRLDLLVNPQELFPHYTYMDFAQGTVAVGIVTWLLSPILGITSWTLQASSMLAEALAVAILAAPLVVVTPSRWKVALGLAPWILAPGFAVVWQMLPFGNHTELLWVPLGIALFLAWRPPEHRPLWQLALPLALLTAGTFCYRGVLTAVGALALCGLWSRSRRFGLWALAVTGLSVTIVAGLLLYIYEAHFLDRPLRMLLAYTSGTQHGEAMPWLGEQAFRFPPHPVTSHSGPTTSCY